MAPSKNPKDKFGLPEVSLHQVIKIKTINCYSELYSSELRLLYRWLMLVSSQLLKLTSRIKVKILNLYNVVEINI